MTDQTSATTQPIVDAVQDKQVYLAVAATYQDPDTKALYVHKDLVQVQEPWAEDAYIAPMEASEQFGDVESFAAYVRRYSADPVMTFATWNNRGLRAILDYSTSKLPGRCQWSATMPFQTSSQWRAWMSFASSQAIPQRQVVEKLEDLAADIVDPKPADLMLLLRSLRATVNAKSDVELRPDGTSKVAFERDAKVANASALELPASFAIAIPVLKGHLDAEGRPVVYRLEVRLRVSIDDSAKLTFRLSIPTAERVLEDVYAERVAAAKGLLGESFSLLRASDG